MSTSSIPSAVYQPDLRILIAREAVTRPSRVRWLHWQAGALLSALTMVGLTLWLGLAAVAASALTWFATWLAQQSLGAVFIGLMAPVAIAVFFAAREQERERDSKVYFDVR